MDISILQIIWFALTGVLLMAFTVTGGFDFGAGITLGFLKGDRQKDYAVRSIIPYWHANEVWLIIAGGAIFAAFPKAYSDILSTMYTPIMLLLFLLVLRVVAIKFYFLKDSKRWKSFLGNMIYVTSLLSATLIGVALGAIFEGTLLTRRVGFWNDFLRLFTPLSVCAGILYCLFFAAYGSWFLTFKSPTPFDANRIYKIARIFQILLMFTFIAYTIALFFKIKTSPILLWGAGGLAVSYMFLSAAAKFGRRAKFVVAFALDAVFAATLIATHCMLAFPYIIRPNLPTEAGLKISAASSSPTTLAIMLVVAAAGIPLAIAYNIYVWRVFSVKKSAQENDYFKK